MHRNQCATNAVVNFGWYFFADALYKSTFYLLTYVLLCLALDIGGVFKARKSRDETKDAEEVRDNAETKRDVPADLQDAEQVEVKYHMMYGGTLQRCNLVLW